jgi:uncharacterized membrane protein
MKRHRAGRDLSADLKAAPHGIEVLERVPQVGTLAGPAEAERPLPGFLSALLTRYPSLRRHPHPMTVHFPIVFFLSAAFFDVLYLAVPSSSFETTAFHCLAGGLLFLPVAMITGLLTWWLNYLARPMRPVTLKIILSQVLFVLAVALLVWRFHDPGILLRLEPAGIFYLLLNLAMVPLVSVIGWLGAGLTFPTDKR